jgi:hypothetical protein
MTALLLTPQDTNYVTSSLVFQQLSENKVEVLLSSIDVSATEIPLTVLSGNGEAQLTGAITIDSNPIADMPLCALDVRFIPEADYTFPVSVFRAGVTFFNAIKISTSGVVFLLNAPLAADVVYLDCPKFLLKTYK